jgi:hypothetical protein
MPNRTITAAEAKEILEKLNAIQADVNTIKVELAETRGAYRLAKFVIALMGVSGLGGLTAWFAGQGK